MLLLPGKNKNVRFKFLTFAFYNMLFFIAVPVSVLIRPLLISILMRSLLLLLFSLLLWPLLILPAFILSALLVAAVLLTAATLLLLTAPALLRWTIVFLILLLLLAFSIPSLATCFFKTLQTDLSNDIRIHRLDLLLFFGNDLNRFQFFRLDALAVEVFIFPYPFY